MLEIKDGVKKIVHPGDRLDVGITRHRRQNKMIIEIDKANASYKGKKWSHMTDVEQDNLEDLLYLTNIQTADVRFLYI